MCADLVNVLIHSDDGMLAEAIANLEEISSSGVSIQLEEAIHVGTDIEVLCSTCSFRGKVSYCRFVDIGYDIGVKFAPQTFWNRQLYQAKHLLSVPIRIAHAAGQAKPLHLRKAGASDSARDGG
jgi:hypothetical protein